MSPDTIMLLFTSLSFATVFLALVIGLGGDEISLLDTMNSFTPSAKRLAQNAALDRMIRTADEAIEARRLGKRIDPNWDIF